ncbi:MAG: chemotaxis protein CheC [Epulopiscium sp.]|nr:chemotaxis protein CheC [Candidatus Epulonipiscium sp.]
MRDNQVRYDILKELFNISVGQAASMLSEVVNKTILLDVPNIEILDSNKELSKLQAHLPAVLDGTLMVSSITFKEQLTGEANLIFPAEKMKTFISLCLDQEEQEIQYSNMNFTDIDFDIVKEIGNIILNAIVGGLSNHLNIQLQYTLPEVQVFDRIDFQQDIKNKDYPYFLMLYITFGIDNTEIEGAVIVNLTLHSLKELMAIVTKIEDELYG